MTYSLPSSCFYSSLKERNETLKQLKYKWQATYTLLSFTSSRCFIQCSGRKKAIGKTLLPICTCWINQIQNSTSRCFPPNKYIMLTYYFKIIFNNKTDFFFGFYWIMEELTIWNLYSHLTTTGWSWIAMPLFTGAVFSSYWQLSQCIFLTSNYFIPSPHFIPHGPVGHWELWPFP